MKITQAELTTLIMEAVDGKCAEYDFGVHGVTLPDKPCNQWAIDRINEIRNPVTI